MNYLIQCVYNSLLGEAGYIPMIVDTQKENYCIDIYGLTVMNDIGETPVDMKISWELANEE